MSEIRWSFPDQEFSIGDVIPAAVRWYGEVNEIPPDQWSRGEGPIGVMHYGISFGWNADVLRFLRRRSPPNFPHLKQFFPRVRAGGIGAYRINERDKDGSIVNDGDAQLINFGNFGVTRGDALLCPSPQGTVIAILDFEVTGSGGTDLRWLDVAGESRSLVDNCILFSNDRPNRPIEGISWVDADLEIPGDSTGDPDPGSGDPMADEREAAMMAILEYIEHNEVPAILVDALMRLIMAWR